MFPQVRKLDTDLRAGTWRSAGMFPEHKDQLCMTLLGDMDTALGERRAFACRADAVVACGQANQRERAE
jgi:hypothetical protein